MSTDPTVREAIERAAESVGPAWPLHSFVTANPLAGFEDRPFPEAVREGERLFGGRGYPSAGTFRRAWNDGRIDTEVLSERLAEAGYDEDPGALLDRLERAESGDGGEPGERPQRRVDAVLTKWLAAFFDQGRTDWPMPDREAGFYDAVRAVAPHDREIPDRKAIADLPEDPVEAVRAVLADHPADRWTGIVEYHLAALPGWTGFLKRRIEDGGVWQSAHPVTLAGYLGIRLALAEAFDAPIAPPDGSRDERRHPDGEGTGTDVPLPEVWLSAWEATYREELVGAVTEAGRSLRADREGDRAGEDGEDRAAGDARDRAGEAGREPAAAEGTTRNGGGPDQGVHGTIRNGGGTDPGAEGTDPDTDPAADGRPAAQLVFCIDTRSEVIRRHVERVGPYETHGYAGFFGVPMRYEGYDREVPVDACPPIVDAEHRIAERPLGGRESDRSDHDLWSSVREAGGDLLHELTTNPGTAFSFVESAGPGYGLALAARTLLPGQVYDALAAAEDRIPGVAEFCAPTVDRDPSAPGELPLGLTVEEKVEYAATAFELMDWEEFARVVVFAGHASQTANNPFDSALDCGACAGNPGGPSARVLAAICNEEAVRERLGDRGIEVPEDTVFVAAEHDTTTDRVTLYDGAVPESHADDLERLRADLEAARAGAAAERAGDVGADPGDGVRETERRAADWAQPRPEWGLAGNAAFVIGPRELTAGLDLDGRAFLHSYDPATDPEGEALAAIMAGPMVVTQWINCQYYFATVDTGVYGSGSKVTQNPVGNVGVYQGNGGDLLTGLPLQSVRSADDEPYHQPLRLSVVVAAPVERVTGILRRNDGLAELLDNGWLSLTVVDPEREYRAHHYDGGLSWRPLGTTDPAPAEAVNPPAPGPTED